MEQKGSYLKRKSEDDGVDEGKAFDQQLEDIGTPEKEQAEQLDDEYDQHAGSRPRWLRA